MPVLYLLRHAKSSWDDPLLEDHDRPLAPRGIRAAEKLRRHLDAAGVRPQLVLCSTAARARQTLAAVAEALGPARIEYEDGLYAATEGRLLLRLRLVPEGVESVMLVGHNPGLEELATALARTGAELPRLREKFPTGALATIRLQAPRWASLAPGDGELVSLIVPREL